MEWERRILHSASLHYEKYGKASMDSHTPSLPYPLFKHEFLRYKEIATPSYPQEVIGGYKPISLGKWLSKEDMVYQLGAISP